MSTNLSLNVILVRETRMKQSCLTHFKLLPMSYCPWTDISMDFIGLPCSHGKDIIFLVVDRLNKCSHIIPLKHRYTALEVAQVFIDNVFKLYGLSSDNNLIFTSNFWQGLFVINGIKLLMSSVHHPINQCQSEVVNRHLEQYFRCVTNEKPKE